MDGTEFIATSGKTTTTTFIMVLRKDMYTKYTKTYMSIRKRKHLKIKIGKGYEHETYWRKSE